MGVALTRSVLVVKGGRFIAQDLLEHGLDDCLSDTPSGHLEVKLDLRLCGDVISSSPIELLYLRNIRPFRKPGIPI